MLCAPLAQSAVVLAQDNGVKQPIFLICPHAAAYSAWSIYVIVDSQDHGKILSLGVESLKNKNSMDSSYRDVFMAQNDSKIQRELVAALNAKDFGAKELRVTEDDALHVSLTPLTDGTYELMASMRVGAFDRFGIGGKGVSKRDVVLIFDPSRKAWSVQIKTMCDNRGTKIAGLTGKTMTGIVFPVTWTGIYTVVGMFEGGISKTLLDRSFMANAE